MKSIETFKKQIKSFAKTSLMEVEIYPPDKLDEIHSFDFEEYKFTCEASQLPGFIFKSENRSIGGLVSEMPVGFEHERLQLTFLCRGHMQERKMFDDWFMLIQDKDTLRLEYYDNYVADIIVKSYDPTGVPNYCVKYLSCYPNIMTSQNLTWAEDNVLRLTVDFSYEKWVPLDNCRDEKINEINQKNKFENDKNNRDGEYNPVQDNKFKKTKENPQGEPSEDFVKQFGDNF